MKKVKVLNIVAKAKDFKPLSSDSSFNMSCYPNVEKELETWVNQGWTISQMSWDHGTFGRVFFVLQKE